MPPTTSVFNLPSPKNTSHAPKIHISHTQLPQSYLDPSHPPTTRHPFKQIRTVPFVRNLTLCMPTHIYASLYDDHDSDHDINTPASRLTSASKPPPLHYAKTLTTLSTILSDHHLRTGPHTLLSNPHPHSPSAHNVTMRLHHGTLILDMPQAVYQRSGLTFPVTKTQSGGRKHETSSARFRVEIDLRGSGMVKGRKGFERLVGACGRVEGLREGRVWLFCENDNAGEGTKRKRERGDEGGVSGRNGNVDVDVGGRGATDTDTDAVTTSSSAGPRTATITSTSPSNLPTQQEHDHPLAKHHPTLIVEPATITTQHDVLVPSIVSRPAYLASFSARSATSTSTSAFKAQNANHTGTGGAPPLLEDDVHELVEYLGLLCLGSPRITRRDYGRVDPYLCRYVLPCVRSGAGAGAGAEKAGDVVGTGSEEGEVEGGGEGDADVRAEDVTSVGYSGFVSADFVMRLVVDLVRRSRVRKSGEGSAWGAGDGAAWMAISVDAFPTEAKGGVDGYLILLHGGEADSAGGEGVEEAPREEGSVDVGDFGRQDDMDEKLMEERGREVRGFRYVTCFEFVDSMTH